MRINPAAVPSINGPYVDMQNGLNALTDAQLKTKAQQTANQYQAPLLQNQVTSGQLANQRSSATLPYAGPQAAATLSQTQLGNKKNQLLMPYVVPGEQADIAQKNQQANYLGTEAESNKLKYPLLQWESQNPSATLSGVQGVFGLRQSAAASGDTATVQKIDDYLAAKNQPDTKGQDETTKARNGMAKVISLEHPNLTNSQAAEAQNKYENGDMDDDGNTVLSDGTKLPPPSTAVTNSLTKVLASSGGVNELKAKRAALIAEKGLKIIEPWAKGAALYSGTMGKLKYYKDAALASLTGNAPPEYQDLQKFNQAAPELATQMLNASQARGTKPNIESYKHLVDPVSYKNDPVNSSANMLAQIDMYRNTVGKVSELNAAQQQAELKKENAANIAPAAGNVATNPISNAKAPATEPKKSETKNKTKEDVYVIRDPQGNRVRQNGKAIGGTEAQTRAFLKEHPGYSREKLHG